MAALLSGATACAAGLPGDDRSDEPAPRLRASFRPIHAATYDEALGLWRTPEDINAWIGASFEYDSARAMQLSETQRAAGTSPPIHAPGDFYAKPSGICVDLARFAVDTLRIIAPDVQPRYVMIEFDPLTLAGNVLRRHWVATFQRGGQHYFFADSKRPGHVYGPYESHEAFLGEYAQYRQRTIVAARVLESYQRRLKSKAVAQPFGAR